MFVILGPDGAGKTTLATKLQELTGMPIHHHTMNSTYQEYLNELTHAKDGSVIMDRFIWCEYPYSEVLNREFQYTIKEVHNIVLFCLSFNPVVVLCTHKPEVYTDSYLPIELWDRCLEIYKELLTKERIVYFTYDYSNFSRPDSLAKAIVPLEEAYRDCIKWWLPMREEGIGATGNLFHPDILVVAQDLGPHNVNYLPFETGPTGKMLSELLTRTNTPLNSIAITNYIKAPLGVKRPSNKRDAELFEQELINIEPRGVIFMGTKSLKGIPIVEEHNIPYRAVLHLGYYRHKGLWNVAEYCEQWRKIRAELAGAEIKQTVFKSSIHGGENGQSTA